jgi:GTP cyclohydrolase II
LGLSKIRLLSNHPKRIKGLLGYGLSIEEVLPLDLSEAISLVPRSSGATG